MKARRDKILDVAVNLAAEGGFENVRQRDVATQAGVALGTLYKSFRSKEDILSAALEREIEVLEKRMAARPAAGDTPLERVCGFFQVVTRGLCKKPRYARAVLRAMASGEPEVAGTVARYQERMTRLIIAALRGPAAPKRSKPTRAEKVLAFTLQQLWFASLVGWSAGLFSPATVVTQIRSTGALLLRGLAA